MQHCNDRKRGKCKKWTESLSLFPINTGYIFTLWYENYHISFVATATHEYSFSYHSKKTNIEIHRISFIKYISSEISVKFLVKYQLNF
jgi:hypothetical protein